MRGYECERTDRVIRPELRSPKRIGPETFRFPNELQTITVVWRCGNTYLDHDSVPSFVFAVSKLLLGRYCEQVVKRSYQQFCGLAAALDIIAERWALLIVRDLGPGPRRFTDLFDGLPGIATDVLAERLRSLEAAGVVTQRQLRHPTPAKVYELTDSGMELATISADIAVWGRRLLPKSPAGYRVNARWALQSMAAAYGGGLPNGQYQFTIDDVDFTVTVAAATGAKVSYGPAVRPLTTITTSEKGFFRMVRLAAEENASLPSGVEVTGRTELWRDLFVRLPLGAAQRQ